MKSIRWKCRYCSNYVFVAAIMMGRRVRCPACGDFSVVRPRTKRKRPRWPARDAVSSGDSTTEARVPDASTTTSNRTSQRD